MEQELNFVTLEDDKQYAVIDEITKDDCTYVYLSSISDETDFCIRRVVQEETGKMLVGLKNNEEFEKALVYFAEKNNE